jgi:hypothetical protein
MYDPAMERQERIPWSFIRHLPMDHPPTRGSDRCLFYTGPHEGATLDTDRRGAPAVVMDVFLPDEGLDGLPRSSSRPQLDTMMAGFNDFPRREGPPRTPSGTRRRAGDARAGTPAGTS